MPKFKKDLRAVGRDGKLMKMDGEIIDSTIDHALSDPESKILLAIAVNRDGDLIVPVFGPPSEAILNMLKQATHAYEESLKAIRREKES